eukprot:TRINITY_DN14513_c0_g1_i6.p2 TRINITY_DN14513_c0_g1~~TRINITY_DN14513_c0_g1_i6.p2  ORF type:complete len:187 (-),score=-17.32 TRINITY_DN14513_c0_g1_i6:197-757(-)
MNILHQFLDHKMNQGKKLTRIYDSIKQTIILIQQINAMSSTVKKYLNTQCFNSTPKNPEKLQHIQNMQVFIFSLIIIILLCSMDQLKGIFSDQISSQGTSFRIYYQSIKIQWQNRKFMLQYNIYANGIKYIYINTDKIIIIIILLKQKNCIVFTKSIIKFLPFQFRTFIIRIKDFYKVASFQQLID